MSFVLRHKGTGYYLQSHECWTNELKSAMQFNSGLRLVDYVEREGARENPEQLEVLVVPPPSTSALSGSACA
jgi:hypothetical protein